MNETVTFVARSGATDRFNVAQLLFALTVRADRWHHIKTYADPSRAEYIGSLLAARHPDVRTRVVGHRLLAMVVAS